MLGSRQSGWEKVCPASRDSMTYGTPSLNVMATRAPSAAIHGLSALDSVVLEVARMRRGRWRRSDSIFASLWLFVRTTN